MMISTKGRYALRVMIDIAENGKTAPVSLREVSERQDISMKYLESIIAILNKAGYVESYRGKSGGYTLSRSTSEYNMRELLELTEGTLAPVACVDNGCPRAEKCTTVALWESLDKVIGNYLDSITLQDVMNGNINRNI